MTDSRWISDVNKFGKHNEILSKLVRTA